MANMQNNGRCCGRRGSRGCLNSVRGAQWDNYPCYTGACPDGNGAYEAAEAGDDCCRCETCPRRRRCRNAGVNGIFCANLPIAVAANGFVPLAGGVNCQCDGSLDVNCGIICIHQPGTYLASYDVRLPAGTALDTTVTLNVNEASQSSAVTMITPDGGSSYSAQAIFTVCDDATVTLRSTAPITLTDPSLQPLFTLSLVLL